MMLTVGSAAANCHAAVRESRSASARTMREFMAVEYPACADESIFPRGSGRSNPATIAFLGLRGLGGFLLLLFLGRRGGSLRWNFSVARSSLVEIGRNVRLHIADGPGNATHEDFLEE